MSYTDPLKTLKLPTLAYRRIHGDMIETYKIVHNLYDTEVRQGILQMSSTGRRGHTKKLFKKRVGKEVRKNFFSIRIVDMWNDLPQNIIDAPSIKCFEARLDKYWESQNIKYNFKETWHKIFKSITKPDNDNPDIEECDLSP